MTRSMFSYPTALALTIVVLLGATGRVAAQDIVCDGANVDSTYIEGIGPNLVGKVVFAHAPGRPDYIPSWGVALCGQLESFLLYESQGYYQIDFEPLWRPDDASKTWELPQPVTSYGGSYGGANDDIMVAIHQMWLNVGNPAVWAGVDKVIMVYEFGSCVLPGGPCPRGRGDLSEDVNLRPGAAVGFSGNGCTLVLADGELDQPLTYRFLTGVAHEFGHTIQLFDIGGAGTCGAPPTALTNVGRYDLMRSPGDALPADAGVPSFHPRDLVRPHLEWIPRVDVSSADGDQTLRIPNIREPNRGAVFYVGKRKGTQLFLLANYEPGIYGPWDDIYGGDGLLIWHVRASGVGTDVWDLESADGKWLNGDADPINGLDALEADWCHRGSGRDFFGRRPLEPPPGKPVDEVPRDFTGATNPNSNYYGPTGLAQPYCSDVEFRNIRRDTNGDMLVDVSWLRQPIVSPNGGEYFVRGQMVPIQWTVSATRQECILGVDVYLRLFNPLWDDICSTIGPPTCTLVAQGLPNIGTASITIPTNQPFGSAYWLSLQTELTPTVGAAMFGTAAIDGTDAPITIWGIEESSISPVVTTFCQDGNKLVKLDVSWQTSVASDAGVDKLELYFPSHQTPCVGAASSAKTGGAGGTSHQLVWQGTCQTGTFHYHMRSKRGIGETISDCRFFQVTSCPSCPPCPPPCEID